VQSVGKYLFTLLSKVLLAPGRCLRIWQLLSSLHTHNLAVTQHIRYTIWQLLSALNTHTHICQYICKVRIQNFSLRQHTITVAKPIFTKLLDKFL